MWVYEEGRVCMCVMMCREGAVCDGVREGRLRVNNINHIR